MTRTVAVVRMQFLNRMTFVWIPVIVFVASLFVTLAIYGVLHSAGADGVMVGGGTFAPLCYFCAVGVQALTLSFPFSQAMSTTRREFFSGAMLAAALTSVAFTAVFVCGRLVEEATSGWGMNGYFFSIPGIWSSGLAVGGLAFFVMSMAFFIVGFAAATLYKRFGMIALVAVLAGLAVIGVGILWVIGHFKAWASVGSWLVSQGVLGFAGWGLVVTAAIAGASYLLLRRMTV